MSTTSTADYDASVAPGPTKKILVVVSHTHWDREWYQTFQQFRVKLVRLIDRLLTILDSNSEYAFFMLDGQTIVLEDYLEIRPERRADIARHVQTGRLLIGPWYILADQFLVSGEAHIQNLLRGRRTAAEFGKAMRVGYIPDPFGHTGQMPQILRGFDIDSAIFWRGVGPDISQVEFVWVAPDGTTVDGVHLPGNANIGGYSSALAWNQGAEAALSQLGAIKEMIIDQAHSNAALLMNGNDHVEPAADLPKTLDEVCRAFAERGLAYDVVHGTLPMYLEIARQSGIWQQESTPRHVGEFRDSRLAHLLPGVLSARMPIKQRNARIENLLEREAGPALAWASTLVSSSEGFDPASLRALYDTAWKYLLQNHPHDSICGCSIDQVHAEMETRFDWAEQLGEELAQESRRSIVQGINTLNPVAGDKALPLVVFNAVPLRRTEVARLSIATPEGLADVTVLDAEGNALPHRLQMNEQEMLFNMDIPAFALSGMATQAGDEGRMMDYTMASFEFVPTVDSKIMEIRVMAVYQSAAPTDPELMEEAVREVENQIANGVETFRLGVYRQTSADLEFIAKDVPANGYKTFYLRPRQPDEPVFSSQKSDKPEPIENEFYEVSVDAATGVFSVLDKETDTLYRGINQLRDGSDAGDEYNYAPVANELFVEGFFAAPDITVRQGELESTIALNAAMELPISVSSDRQSRGTYKTVCPVHVVVKLVPGQRRIDFTTSFSTEAEDHRLQVLFPTPFAVTSSHSEQAFDVVERPVELPAFDKSWREDPMPGAPQKSFVSVYDPAKKLGLTVINQGLPEYEIIPAVGDKPAAVALTLLRCVGWLSRSDLSTRRDHAGPGLATPAAQLRGDHTFHYALMPHKGDWLQAGAQQQAHAFNHPMTGIAAGKASDGQLPAEASFVEMMPRAIALSTVKPSEDGRAIIVRFWNPATRDIPTAKIRFYRAPARVSLVNLAEDGVLQELSPSEDGFFTFPLAAKRIATLRVEF